MPEGGLFQDMLDFTATLSPSDILGALGVPGCSMPGDEKITQKITHHLILNALKTAFPTAIANYLDRVPTRSSTRKEVPSSDLCVRITRNKMSSLCRIDVSIKYKRSKVLTNFTTQCQRLVALY